MTGPAPDWSRSATWNRVFTRDDWVFLYRSMKLLAVSFALQGVGIGVTISGMVFRSVAAPEDVVGRSFAESFLVIGVSIFVVGIVMLAKLASDTWHRARRLNAAAKASEPASSNP